MKDSIKCPICGKNGIPDFHKEDVVCPCCGSDLSVYHRLSDLSEKSIGNSTNTKRYNYLISLVSVLVFISAIGCVSLYIREKQINELSANKQIIELQKQNSILNDSIMSLKKKIVAQAEQQEKTFESIRTYVVKKGDSFCKISKQLYGTEARYIEIVKLNNLNAETVLHEGDSLKVSEK